jgi:hypothetical protein
MYCCFLCVFFLWPSLSIFSLHIIAGSFWSILGALSGSEKSVAIFHIISGVFMLIGNMVAIIVASAHLFKLKPDEDEDEDEETDNQVQKKVTSSEEAYIVVTPIHYAGAALLYMYDFFLKKKLT